jgi:exosortase/archaeosortase family protein
MKKIDNLLKNYSEGFKELALRTIVFLFAFISISYFIGQKIVASQLLYGFDIYIYGGMGYLFLFCVLGFFVLSREKLFKLKKEERVVIDYVFLILSMVFLALFYIIEINIDIISENFINKILIHVIFLSTFITLVLGVIGVNYVKNIARDYKREILYFLIFFVLSYSLMNYVWKLWPYLSFMVSKAVYLLLKLLSDQVILRGDDVLIFEGFGAKIGEACSGIYSIFIFSGLFVFIVFMDWYKINKKKAALLFLPAVLGAFLVNIFRVFLLMVVGAYFSEEAALGLYHSYTGMVFFMIYFVIFWYFAYKWMKN